MKQTEHPYWHRLYRCLEDFGTRYQNIPDFFKDRIQRYGILSLFILLFGAKETEQTYDAATAIFTRSVKSRKETWSSGKYRRILWRESINGKPLF